MLELVVLVVVVGGSVVLVVEGDSVARREERECVRLVRWVDCLVRADVGAGFRDEEVEVEVEVLEEWRRWRGVGGGDVWVPMSRWKSSVGSESIELLSEVWSRSRFFSKALLGMAGMWLTFPSSFSFSFSRL